MIGKSGSNREQLLEVVTAVPVWLHNRTGTKWRSDTKDTMLQGLQIYRTQGTKHIFFELNGKVIELYPSVVASVTVVP
jgi:5-methylthioribose kinase